MPPITEIVFSPDVENVEGPLLISGAESGEGILLVNAVGIVIAPVVENFTLTAAEIGIAPGRLIGFTAGILGALVPATLNGQTVELIATQETPPLFGIRLTGIHASDFFTSLLINGTNFLAVDATYLNPGGTASQWNWTVAYPAPFTLGAGDYPVAITL